MTHRCIERMLFIVPQSSRWVHDGAVGRPPKSAFLVAERIAREIVRTGVHVGDLLPPARVMLDQYATTRTTREALRLLEFPGLILQEPGRRGP